MLRGCRSPIVFYLETFTCWHTRHLLTYSTIFFFILRHQKCCFRSWYIFVPPGCIEKGELCASVRISFFISLTVGTHQRPWHTSSSSVDLEKLSTGPTVNWFRILFRLGSSRCESMILCLSVGRTVSRAIWTITSLVTTTMSACSKSARTRGSFVMRAEECTVFELSVSATTIAFPRWYWISMSYSFTNSSHLRCLKFFLCEEVF